MSRWDAAIPAIRGALSFFGFCVAILLAWLYSTKDVRRVSYAEGYAAAVDSVRAYAATDSTMSAFGYRVGFRLGLAHGTALGREIAPPPRRAGTTVDGAASIGVPCGYWGKDSLFHLFDGATLDTVRAWAEQHELRDSALSALHRKYRAAMP